MPTRTVQPVSNPYAGGAIVADFTPYLNLALQQKAKEDAKAAAAQKVFDDMMKDPNPKGIRQQDTQGFYDKTNDWRTFGIQNKKEITNPALDGGKALLEFRKKVADISGYINSSIDAKDRDLKLFAPIFSDPEKSSRISTSFMNQYQQFQKPLNLGGGGVIDVNNMFGAKPLNEKEAIETIITGLKPTDLSTTFVPIQGDKFNRLLVTEKSYDKKALESNAKDLYRTNPSFKATIDNLWKESGMKINPNGTVTPPTGYVADLQKNYTDDKGNPKEIKSLDDIAAAWSQNKIRSWKEQKPVENKEAIMKEQEASKKRYADYVHNFKLYDENQKDIWMDNYIKNDLIGDIKDVTGMWGAPIKEIKLDKITSEALKKDGKTPDKLEYDVNNKLFKPIYYKYDNQKLVVNEKTGAPAIDELLSQPINYNQFKLNLVNAAPQGQQAVREMKKDKTIGAGKKTVESNTKSTNFVNVPTGGFNGGK